MNVVVRVRVHMSSFSAPSYGGLVLGALRNSEPNGTTLPRVESAGVFWVGSFLAVLVQSSCAS